MRVALNLEQLLSPSPGGVGRYCARLAAGLASLGVEVQPVVARHGSAQLQAAWQEFGLEALPTPLVLPLPRPVLYDAWHLLAWPPRRWPGVDLVHAPSLAVPPRGGKPLVVSIHDAAPWLYPEAFTARGRWFHARGARAAARRADLVVTGTAAAAAEICSHLSLTADRVRVVPYGVDIATPARDRRMSPSSDAGAASGARPISFGWAVWSPARVWGLCWRPWHCWPTGARWARTEAPSWCWPGMPVGRTATFSRRPP